MTENETVILNFVKRNNGVCVSQVADSLGMNNGSVLFVLKSLMVKGEVFRAEFGRKGKGCGKGTQSNFYYYDSQEKASTAAAPVRKKSLSIFDYYRAESKIYWFDTLLREVRTS